jgi:hypothetical protein
MQAVSYVVSRGGGSAVDNLPDHVHLGPGVTGTRKTNPAVDLHDLPRIDLVRP